MRIKPKMRVKPLATTKSNAAKVTPLSALNASIDMGGSAWGFPAGGQVPGEDLLAVPQKDARELAGVLVDGLQVLDAVRNAADVRVDGDGHDLGAPRALLVEPVE